MAGKKVLTLDRGATLKLVLRFWQDAAKTVPLDLTGYSVALEDNNFPTSATPAVTVLPAPGQIQIYLSPTQTATLRRSPEGNPQYWFKFQTTDHGGVSTDTGRRINRLS
jgi:hypothetical protein